MTVTEARAMALALGYKLVKHDGEDRWFIRDAFTDARVAKAMPFTAVVGMAEARGGFPWKMTRSLPHEGCLIALVLTVPFWVGVGLPLVPVTARNLASG